MQMITMTIATAIIPPLTPMAITPVLLTPLSPKHSYTHTYVHVYTC